MPSPRVICKTCFYQRAKFALKEIKELLDASNHVKKAAFQARIILLEEHRQQEKQNQIEDSLSKEEYEDSFKGSK